MRNKKAYYVFFIIASIVVDINALVIMRYFTPAIYAHTKGQEYTFPMKLLDNLSLLVHNPAFVLLCCGMFSLGIVFMGILNWVGFGRDE